MTWFGLVGTTSPNLLSPLRLAPSLPPSVFTFASDVPPQSLSVFRRTSWGLCNSKLRKITPRLSGKVGLLTGDSKREIMGNHTINVKNNNKTWGFSPRPY